MDIQSLYPDLEECGGLSAALQSALEGIQSPLKLNVRAPMNPETYAWVGVGDRFSQIYIAAEERRFLFDCWEQGVLLAAGSTDSLVNLAQALDAWIAQRFTVSGLSAGFLFVVAGERAEAFEQGREVEWKWRQCWHYIPSEFPDLVPFLEAASQNETLRHLFPFTSLNRFCFSRCTGYPYSYDCPIVTPLGYDQYEVLDAQERPIGRGDGVEAVNLVMKHLPRNCGVAVKGTAEDLNTG